MLPIRLRYCILLTMKNLSKNEAPETFQNRNLLILIAILLLAAFLRIFLIGNHGFWLDEIYSIRFADNNLQELIRKVALFDNHPPTYYILLHYWILLFGDSELSVRIPSAMFSVLSVLFTYKVGKILFDTRVATIAALLLALSSFSIYYGQEARMYSFLAFASVLSVYFLLRYLDKQTPWSLINYVWSTTLLVYLHLYGLFILLAENLYILTIIYVYSDNDTGISLKKWVPSQIAILLLSLPWLASLTYRILVVTDEGFWVETPTLDSLITTFAVFSGTHRMLPVWVFLLFLGMFFALITRTKPGKNMLEEQSSPGRGRAILLLSLLLFTPIILPYLVSQFVTPIYIVRCTIAGHFAFYLLVASGITIIRSMRLRYAALAIVLMLSVFTLAREGYVHHNADQVRQAVEYIERNIEENDVVLLCGDLHLDMPFKYYAEKQKNPIYIINIPKPDNGIVLPEHMDVGRLWFIRRTDRQGWCKQLPQTISHQYVRTNMPDTTFRKLELTTLKRDQASVAVP